MSGRRPIPEGKAEMEADVREVIRELEAEGAEVTAGNIREAYGGKARGSWQPHGDPENPDVPPDSLDPLMEEVFRELGLPGATAGPEALPTVGSAGAEAVAANVSDLPLIQNTGPMMAIEESVEVRLSYRSPFRLRGDLPRSKWVIDVVGPTPEKSFSFEVGTGFGNSRLDLHRVRDMLAARGVQVEPIRRWWAPPLSSASTASTLFRIRSNLTPPSPWASAPRYRPARPSVYLTHQVSYEGGVPQHAWSYWVESGGPRLLSQSIDGRHITADGKLNVVSFAEALRQQGIAVEEPESHLLDPPPPLDSGRAGRGLYARLPSAFARRTTSQTVTLDGVTYLDGKDPSTATKGGNGLKWAVGGAGGMLLMAIALPQVFDDDGKPVDDTAPPIVEIEDDLDDGALIDDAPPVGGDDVDTSDDEVVADDGRRRYEGPVPDPPAAYVNPDVDGAGDPGDRAFVSGSIWGSQEWTRVDVYAVEFNGFLSSPPPTVAPEGKVDPAEIVLRADCTDEESPETCRFWIDRVGTRVDLELTGLTLVGKGDTITENCTGSSSITYTVSDLVVDGGRLLPTYVHGTRTFDEVCNTWERYLTVTFNGRWVDQPSRTP